MKVSLWPSSSSGLRMRSFLPFLQEKQRGLLSGLRGDWSPIGSPVVVLFLGRVLVWVLKVQPYLLAEFLGLLVLCDVAHMPPLC